MTIFYCLTIDDSTVGRLCGSAFSGRAFKDAYPGLLDVFVDLDSPKRNYKNNAAFQTKLTEVALETNFVLANVAFDPTQYVTFAAFKDRFRHLGDEHFANCKEGELFIILDFSYELQYNGVDVATWLGSSDTDVPAFCRGARIIMNSSDASVNFQMLDAYQANQDELGYIVRRKGDVTVPMACAIRTLEIEGESIYDDRPRLFRSRHAVDRNRAHGQLFPRYRTTQDLLHYSQEQEDQTRSLSTFQKNIG